MPPRFRYCLDPLFFACLAAYWLNRIVIKPHTHATFPHAYLNDLICLPFWVPIMLALQRAARLRSHDAPPLPVEILIPLVLWSWAFEVWLPGSSLGRNWCTADPWDIVCYSLGALGAGVFWRWWYTSARSSETPSPAAASAAPQPRLTS